MKLIVFAALIVVASALETDESAKDKRQVLLPGALGFGGLGYGYGGFYPGFYGAGFYGGYPGGIIGRKRRAAEEGGMSGFEKRDAEEGPMNGFEKRQILTPYSYGLGAGVLPLGYPGFYGAGFYGGYPGGIIGRKRRAAEEGGMNGFEKRQVIGGVYPGVGGMYPGGVYPGGVIGAPLVGAPVVGAPVLGAPVLGGGLGLGGVGLGAPVVDTGYGLPTAVVGRKRREVDVESETIKEKRQLLMPGALGFGYGLGYGGYPGFLGGGFYPGFYGAGLYGGFPGAIL